MSSPGTPLPAASFPVPPPVPTLPVIDLKTGQFNSVGINFITLLWAAIQGSGGIVDTYLQKFLAENGIFVGDTNGIATGVQMGGDATIAFVDGETPSAEVTVSRVRVQMTAGLDLSGHRVVTADPSGLAVYPDNTVLNDGIGLIGITTGSIVSGESGPVQVIGEMEEPSWGWTPGQQIYVDNAGVLTQSIPAAAWVAAIAVARTATMISIFPRILTATP